MYKRASKEVPSAALALEIQLDIVIWVIRFHGGIQRWVIPN